MSPRDVRWLPLLGAALASAACRNDSSAAADAGRVAPRDAAAPATSASGAGVDAADASAESDGDEASPDAGARDHIHVETDGITKDVWASGWASIPHPRHPEYAFAGALGCAERRFKTKLTKNVRLDIGYTARKAFVVVGDEPYVLEKPPTVEGKTLVWAGDFLHADGSKRRFLLRVDCPLPPK